MSEGRGHSPKDSQRQGPQSKGRATVQRQGPQSKDPLQFRCLVVFLAQYPHQARPCSNKYKTHTVLAFIVLLRSRLSCRHVLFGCRSVRPPQNASSVYLQRLMTKNSCEKGTKGRGRYGATEGDQLLPGLHSRWPLKVQCRKLQEACAGFC